MQNNNIPNGSANIIDRETVLKSWARFIRNKPADFNPRSVTWMALQTGFTAGYMLSLVDCGKATQELATMLATIQLPIPQGTQL